MSGKDVTIAREYVVALSLQSSGKVKVLITDNTTKKIHAVNAEDFARLNSKSITPRLIGDLIVDLFKEAITCQ